ncbi:glycosyltransferase family 39 protein [Nonomuraea sp. SMC257]|uniref:Glycosyltransferase family 39 protein n=1 Tax=Nonomuraea montanisoli TaxID=2741721 RepID=A0A7Y6I7K6_9ACTN|nr:glycosyltransferase family 39 protein [Nonomuraea montanisoli]NUW32871.1 glycosyltransferase family 39 protein [Nonomuraea montanisoli]
MERPPLAWRSTAVVAACLVAVLLLLGQRYGYHRDELYFRVLSEYPAWGYVDQPPLTPLIARLSIALFGDTLFALKVFPALAAALLVVLATLITREFGGARVAQTVTALGVATGAYTLVAGHSMLTLSFDLPFWAAAGLFAVKALRREDPRWWLAFGAVTGLATYNKLLIAMLVLGLAAGLLLAGPRRVLISPWLWAGAALALVLAVPNLVYQATHDWPQLTMAAALSDNEGDEQRLMFVPMQFGLFGPVVAVIAGFGWWRLWKDRRVRAIAVAFPVAAVLTVASGGRFDYTGGLLLLLFTAGCVSVEAAGAGRVRLAVAALAVNGLLCAVIALPLLPADRLAATPVPAINEVARESVGWPEFAAAVRGILASLPPEERDRAIVLTGSYGEQGALARAGIPRVYSGQNQLHQYGPPPETGTVAVAVNIGRRGMYRQYTTCEQRAVVDNRVGVDNEMQGMPVFLCHGLKGSWRAAWPRYLHYS